MVCVGGRYQLLGELGSGGTSTVFLAVDTVLHKQWAIKETLLKGNEDYQKYIIQSLRAEVDVLKECDHPAIPRIVDFFEENGRAYAVRDYVKGRSLKSIVESHGIQDARSVREWGMQLCSVLSYLHAHYPPIVYGDLKPSHVMITDDGLVRLIDFGAATQLYTNGGVLDLRSIEQPEVRFATPRFTAPEVFDENSVITASSDVYSLGMTLRYALFPNDSYEDALKSSSYRENRELFDSLIAVLATATALEPSQRYEDCGEMLIALEDCFEDGSQFSGSKGYYSNNLTRKQLRDKAERNKCEKRKNRNKFDKRSKCDKRNKLSKIDQRCQNNLRNKDSLRNQSLDQNSLLNGNVFASKKSRMALLLTVVIATVSLLLFSCLGAFYSNAAIKPSNKVSYEASKSSRIKLMRKSKSEYDSYIRLAERESSVEVTKRYISRAMIVQNSMLKKGYVREFSLMPMRVLLKAQLADYQWSDSEERGFMGLLNKYEKQLRNNRKGWCEISGDIGKAYWYYFAGFSGKVSSAERLSRMRVAKAWFNEALKNSDNAENSDGEQNLQDERKSQDEQNSYGEQNSEEINQKRAFNIYIAISEGYSQLVDVTQDSNNVETYSKYAKQLTQLVKMAQKDKSDILRVDTGELILQSLRGWLRMFREGGFSKQEASKLCDEANILLESAHVANEEAEQRRKTALDSVKQVKNEISVVFSEK